MNKKLLLSTIATAILVTNSTQAVDFDVNYNGNNTFTYNGKHYDSFQALGTIINRAYKSAREINPNEDINVKIPDGEKMIMLQEISSPDNNAGLRSQFADFISTLYSVPHPEVYNLLDYAKNVYAKLPVDQQNFLLNAIEVNDLVKFKEKEFVDTINYVKSNAITEEIIGKTGLKFTAMAKKINDATVQKLIPEMQALFAKERDRSKIITPEDKAREKELTKFIFGRPELNSLRNSPENQELLKEYIANLQYGATLNNSKISDIVKQKTDALANFIDVFLVTDVKDATTVPPVQKSDTALTEGMMNSQIMTTNQLIDARINGFAAAAPAAGDLLQSYGVWVQGSMTSATQKAYKNAPGYKLSQKGMTIGADTGDDILLGIAYSYFINDIKNKQTHSNKEDIKSHFFTAYGKFILADNVFLKGQGQFGKSNIKKVRATGDAANNLARAKTHGTSLAGRVEIGYDYFLSTPIHIIPSVGVSYADIKVKGYSESGIGLNRSINKRNSNRLSGLAGVTVNYDVNMQNSIKLMPEIHANIDYAFKTKNSATIVKIFEGIDPIATPAEKLAKAYFNIGTSVKTFQTDRYEISAGYDLGLAKKFQSHTGTVKVRVNI